MKYLLTLLIFTFSTTAFCQSISGDVFKDKRGAVHTTAAAAAKADSLYAIGGDTLRIDLVEHGDFDQLRQVEQERMEIKAQAQVLQERAKGLDNREGVIKDAAYRHDKRYDAKRKVIAHNVIGTMLIVVVEKIPVPGVVEDKKKKQK